MNTTKIGASPDSKSTENEAEGGAGVGVGVFVGVGVWIGVGVAVGTGVGVGVDVATADNSGVGIEVGTGSESPHAVISRATAKTMKVRINGDLRMAVIIALTIVLMVFTISELAGNAWHPMCQG